MHVPHLLSGNVGLFGVTLELRRIEIDFAQVPGAVALRLIVEVWRRRIAARAAGSHGSGSHGRSELNHGDKTIAAGPVHFFGGFVGASAEGRQRTPERRSEGNRQ